MRKPIPLTLSLEEIKIVDKAALKERRSRSEFMRLSVLDNARRVLTWNPAASKKY